MKIINPDKLALRNAALPLALLAVFLGAGPLFAGSATWLPSPSTGNWTTAANWSPATVPSSFTDIATFGTSSITTVTSTSASQFVGSIVFNSGASAFTIVSSPNADLTFRGAGIVNNSGITQNFVTDVSGINTLIGRIDFENAASAGSNTAITNYASGIEGGGSTAFLDNSTAGNSVITNNGGTVSGVGGGITGFFENSTAGTATLIANGGTNGGIGGKILFRELSTGGTAQVKVFGNGQIDLNLNVTIGSLEGSGVAYFRNHTLTVGSNNMSTVFSGSLIGDTLGAGNLTKIGTGTLTLSGSNDYGATTVTAGTLLIDGDFSSGVGAVTVNGGVLGGSGVIQGNATVNSGGTLSPGNSPGTLTFDEDLTLAAGSTAIFESGDLVDVNGTLDFDDNWTLSLTAGFQNGGTITLFTYVALANSPDLLPTFDLTGLGFTPSGPLSLTDTGSAIVLNGISAVPEPSTLALIVVGAGGVLLRRRRA